MPINLPNLSGEYILDVGDTLSLILAGDNKSGAINDLEIKRMAHY